MGVKRKSDDDSGGNIQSVVQAEDGAFPRGGGSVLSSLEIKQAANEAAKDVLFGAPTESDQPKKKKHKKRKNKNDLPAKEEKKGGVKIESLTFAKLVVGTVVLGQISQVNDMDIVLSLPNNLTGFIPITNVSKQLNDRLETELNDNDNDDESDNEDLPDLSMFKVGQWLRALVTSNTSLEANQKKRIELSIEPERVNSALLEETEDLSRPGMAVQGSVKSVEDHGCVIDVGSEHIFGFISKKELNHANLENVTPGLVLLLTVLSKSSNGRTLTLTASPLAKKMPTIESLNSSASLTAGMLVDAKITKTRKSGFVAELLEFAVGTADQIHSGKLEPIDEAFEIGDNVKARVICLFPNSEPKKVALSLQPSVVGLKNSRAAGATAPLDDHPIGEVVTKVTVQVADAMGLYVKFGKNVGYVHVSSVSDDRIDDLQSEEKYAKGTTHQARIVGHADADNMYILSLAKSTLEQQWLRAEDIPVGQVVQCQVEKIVPGKGVSVKLTDSIQGFVDELHLSDIKLAHPEKKFKPGMKVKARVLNSEKRIKLTLKKSLLNSEDEIITSYDTAKVGMKSPGVVISLKPRGVIVEFFCGIKAFLPVSEISEAFIKDPSEHFTVGQSVAVRVLKVEPEAQRMTVTCRSGPDNSQAFAELQPGEVVSAEVVEKTKDNSALVVRLANGLRGVIAAGQLTDEGSIKHKQGMKSIKAGQTLDNLVVLDKDMVQRFVTLSAKKTLVKDAQAGKLPTDWSQISAGKQVHGIVKNVNNSIGVFVGFGNKLVGLLPTSEVGDEAIEELSQKFAVDQLVKCQILSVDDADKRFVLTMKKASSSNKGSAANPVDTNITELGEFQPGCVTKAKIVAIKDTQLNVQLAANQQGRIDASLAFDDVSSMKDIKMPLKSTFTKGDVVDVKIVGWHDARNHRFLPISHRNATHMLAECSCRTEDLESEEQYSSIQLDQVKVGSEWTAIVNNVTSDFVWVNISPQIRGRISILDLVNVDQVTDDIEEFFPVGSAVKCVVTEVGDMLKLSVRQANGTVIQSSEDTEIGAKLPGLITKIDDSKVTVRLGPQTFGTAGLTDLSDEYGEDGVSTVAKFSPHQLVKCQVVGYNGKRIQLSLRPSLFDDSVEVVNKVVSSASDLGKGEVVSGFVKNIAKSGLFVQLGTNVTGRVEIRNLSDAFLSDWQKYFKIGQLVKARVLDVNNDKVNLTLKESAVAGETKVTGASDLEEGQILDGTIKRIEEYGVFVRMEGGASGLCHKSQVADIPINDLDKVFSIGDKVKVKVLSVDKEKGRVALGMKASYLGDDEDMSSQEDEDQEDAEEGSDSDEEMIDFNRGDSDEDEDEEESDSDSEQDQSKKRASGGLSANFDWTASILDQAQENQEDDSSDSDSDDEGSRKKKRKRTKTITQDNTASINNKLPQSNQDYERLLLGSPNSSILWMNYMAFQLQLSEIDKARDIGERALKTISFREEQEKVNVWIAMLNLENSFGTEETLNQVFQRSCQYCDPATMHMKLINIYVASDKQNKAQQLYRTAARKFGPEDTSIYVSYMTFMLKNGDNDGAKGVLDRALQALPRHEHRALITKYAQLQFEHGFLEQGRTFFEQLVSTYAKRVDIWSIYIDYETKYGGDAQQVRQLFERLFKHLRLNIKKGRFFFKKWFTFEEKFGNEKNLEYVKAKAQQFVEEKQKQQQEDAGDEDDE